MKFSKQLNRHWPEKGLIGDCFRTCLACLLDLHPSDVPHFVAENYSEKQTPEFRTRVDTWLRQNHRLSSIDCRYAVEEGDQQLFLDDLARVHGEDLCYLLLGKGSNGPHYCIYRGNKLLWDPAWSNAGITAPINGHYWVTHLIPSFMRYTP